MNSIIILAAGAGTRMKSKLPKVLHKLSGKPIIYFIIKEAQQISDDVHIVLYHQKEKISQYIQQNFENIHIHIQDHDKYPGTGGAIMGIDLKYDKSFVVNGDMPLITAQKLKDFLDFDSDIVISSMNMQNPSGYGRIISDDNNTVKKIVEQKDASESEKKVKKVNAGLYLFKTKILNEFIKKINNHNEQKEYYLTDIIELCIDAKKNVVCVDVDKQYCQGVNNKYELSLADNTMQYRIKKNLMINGAIFESPDSVYCEYDVEMIGENIIDSGVVLRGKSIIQDSHIKANCVIEDAVIANSSIGPMARIRPQSNIKNTHIGNFVEVKKSNLDGVKAGHLSYIGDALIKEGSNIGAGFISCNYDGKNKHKTIIGKNVFVGSGTKLVAPITIEDDVIIGAGSTIRKNIQKGNLVLTKGSLIQKRNYFYDFFKK